MLSIRELVELLNRSDTPEFRALVRWYQHGFFFRHSEDGALAVIGMLPTINGFAPPGGEWEISRRRDPEVWKTKMDVLGTLSKIVELMPPAKAVVVWACPWHDETGELEEKRRIARESIEYWILKGVLNQDILLACKKTCLDRFQRIGASLEAITGDLIVTMEEAVRLSENTPAGLPRATQTRVWFSDDLKEIEMRYPDGRISRHCFLTWPDGEERCDCEWKRYNWNTLCKHELLRDEEKVKRDELKSIQD